jgi:WD40 repeat protein
MNVLAEISRYQVDDHVIALAWAPDSWRCAALSASGALMVSSLTKTLDFAPSLRLQTPPRRLDSERLCQASREATSGRQSTPTTVAVQPAGGLALSWGKPGILTGGQEGMVSCWQANEDGLLVKGFEVDPGERWAEHVLWSADGTRFVTGVGKKLRIWSSTGELLRDYSNQSSSIAALCLRPDNQAVGIGIYGGVRLFRFAESEPYEDLQWKGSIIELCWSPNGRFVAASSQERTINFWRLPFRPGEQLAMSGYPVKVREMAWDSDSRYLATGGCELITIWDVSGKGPAGTRPIQLKFHAERLTALQFQPAGARLASGSKDGKLAIWRSVKEKQPEFVAELNAPISALRWSPCGRRLGVGTSEGEVVLFG